MNSDILRFKGISITKEAFEEKYEIRLTETEWQVIISNATRSYEENAEEYRLLISKHIRLALGEIGYKPQIVGSELKFKKVE